MKKYLSKAIINFIGFIAAWWLLHLVPGSSDRSMAEVAMGAAIFALIIWPLIDYAARRFREL